MGTQHIRDDGFAMPFYPARTEIRIKLESGKRNILRTDYNYLPLVADRWFRRIQKVGLK